MNNTRWRSCRWKPVPSWKLSRVMRPLRCALSVTIMTTAMTGLTTPSRRAFIVVRMPWTSSPGMGWGTCSWRTLVGRTGLSGLPTFRVTLKTKNTTVRPSGLRTRRGTALCRIVTANARLAGISIAIRRRSRRCGHNTSSR